jgi:hypothetical protein
MDDRVVKMDDKQCGVDGRVAIIEVRQDKLENISKEMGDQIHHLEGVWPTVSEAAEWTTVGGKKSTKSKSVAIARQVTVTPPISKIPTTRGRTILSTAGHRNAQNRTGRRAVQVPVQEMSVPISDLITGTPTDAGDLSQDTSVKTVSSGTEVCAKPKRTFSDLCASMPDGKILVVGDSMVRGVGEHLHIDNSMFDKLDFSGARIEDIADKVRLIGDKPQSHLVLMVGTNNLVRDGTEEIMRKYDALIHAVKEVSYQKVSMVNILARTDTTGRQTDGNTLCGFPWVDIYNSKRIGLNARLQSLCTENGFGFVDIKVDVNSMLDRRGLHLNRRGQDTVARRIFRHCVNDLN